MATSTNKHDSAQLATFRSIVDGAIESGETTRKAIGIAAEADDEMVRRWLSGQWPRLASFRRLISFGSLIPIGIKQQLVDWLLRGSCFKASACEPCSETTLDLDGDGIVGKNDVACATVMALREASKAADLIMQSKPEMDERQKAQTREELYTAKASIEKAIAALDWKPDQSRLVMNGHRINGSGVRS